MKLKLFVWEGEGVLTDWGTGLICVLAPDLETALHLIEEKYEQYTSYIPITKYKIIEKPEAFACYGSA